MYEYPKSDYGGFYCLLYSFLQFLAFCTVNTVNAVDLLQKQQCKISIWLYNFHIKNSNMPAKDLFSFKGSK